MAYMALQDAKVSKNFLQTGVKYWTSGTDQYCSGRFRSLLHSPAKLLLKSNIYIKGGAQQLLTTL
jgi:hypothetical protein